jgi:hypothetical protein
MFQFPSPFGIARRNPGRMDGSSWNGSTFICSRRIDGPPFNDLSAEASDYEDDSDSHMTGFGLAPAMINSLLDIARPAKRKGTCHFSL